MMITSETILLTERGAKEVNPACPEEWALPDVLNALEEDIVFGRLHPRERLVEDELMGRFGIKRHIAREALASMERMGLVERRKNIGAFVRSFTPRQVVELYQLRSVLETEAARSIPLPVAADRLEQLMATQLQHDEAVALGDARLVFRLNLLFHQQLFSLADNETLIQAISEYARQTHAIRFLSLLSSDYRDQARTEHWQMIEALKNGEQERLVVLCASHLLPSRNTYLEVQLQRS